MMLDDYNYYGWILLFHLPAISNTIIII